MKRHRCGETADMKNFTRGFFLSAIAAGALVAGISAFAAADGMSTQSPAPAASPYLVTIKNFAFSPSTVTIPLGATVRWKNADDVGHTATSTAPGFDSGNIENGKTFSFRFTKAGTYTYVCSYHSSMTGSVIVEAPANPAPSH